MINDDFSHLHLGLHSAYRCGGRFSAEPGLAAPSLVLFFSTCKGVGSSLKLGEQLGWGVGKGRTLSSWVRAWGDIVVPFPQKILNFYPKLRAKVHSSALF